MPEPIILPRPWSILRELISASGYREHLCSSGDAEDARSLQSVELDEMGSDRRPGSTAHLMMSIETHWFGLLTADCGPRWATVMAGLWRSVRTQIEQIAREIDTDCLDSSTAADLLREHVDIPMLSMATERLFEETPAPNLAEFLKTPLLAWSVYAAEQTDSGLNTLTDSFLATVESLTLQESNSEASMKRWLSGKSVKNICAPYRTIVESIHAYPSMAKPTPDQVDNISAWLAIAIAMQSLAPKLRDDVNNQLNKNEIGKWSVDTCVQFVSRQGYNRYKHTVSDDDALQMQQTQAILFSDNEVKDAAFKLHGQLKATLPHVNKVFLKSSQRRVDHLAAWLAVIEEKHDEAALIFKAAVEKAWWVGGQQLNHLLRDALLHAVGNNMKVRAKYYWDRLRLLNSDNVLKEPLNDTEWRRLSLAYEATFYPCKAKERVPPKIEIMSADVEKGTTSIRQAGIDSKNCYADGRTRRTPLMQAIVLNKLSDIRALIDKGADVNRIIPESGESALTWALSKAKGTKNFEIVHWVIDAGVSKDTCNHQASTQRNTPLGLAIEAGDVSVVAKLIRVGAHVEAACDIGGASPLCHALSLLQFTFNPFDRDVLAPWLAGNNPDGTDAKYGAVTKSDAAAVRQSQFDNAMNDPRQQSIAKEMFKHMLPAPENLRSVIAELLDGGADPNNVFTIPSNPDARWTPTAHAAQVGDLEAFKLILNAGGDFTHSVIPIRHSTSKIEVWDSLYIAKIYNHHKIVSYLMSMPA